jgi:sugar/nucleoside kinase (ribokinase family)
MVPIYPYPDSKMRTTSYHEIGGGNAANTACAMNLLLGSTFFLGARHSRHFTVRLATKIGGDGVGAKIVRELQESGVDLSSPLFRIGEPDSTTGFTTVIVAAKEQTRTCIHTPGTCGELTMADLQAVEMDDIFESVVHLHSDSRHTEVALALASEAHRRGIPVSLDVEKDRGTSALDTLLEVATIIFTNSEQVDEYLNRLNRERESSTGTEPLPLPVVRTSSSTLIDEDMMSQYASAIRPSSYFTRWFHQKTKEVVITRGSSGAIHVSCEAINVDADVDGLANQNDVFVYFDDRSQRVKVSHNLLDRQVVSDTVTACSAAYIVSPVGVIKPREVVDTTGAGDAYIAGFLAARVANFPTDFSMKLGAWVSGRKVEGHGARSSLPTSRHVDEALGVHFQEAAESLSRLVGDFGR